METKRLLELCTAGDKDFNFSELKTLLAADYHGDLDIADEQGMTALMHCAFRGRVEACGMLLDRGADVNSNKHKNGYTALMFAAMAGHADVVALLLRAGANPDTVNNLGKTASNIAGFVGQPECVKILMNYFSLNQLEEFTRPMPLSGQSLLPPPLVHPLHSLLVTTRLHPVAILLELEKCPALIESCSDMASIVKTLGQRLVTEHREGLALKLHYLSYCIQLAHKHGIEAVLKRVLTFDDSGRPVEMDLFLRQCLREFPHPQLPLLKQVITSLAKTAPGDSPNAYSLIISLILGDKEAAAIADACYSCGRTSLESLKKCSRCKKAWYCSVQCQQLAWTQGNHKKLCKRWATPTTTPS